MTSWRILGTTEPESALRASLGELLDRRGIAPVASREPTAVDRALWAELCSGLGMGDLATARIEPGDEVGPATLMATCFEVLGERLAPLPHLSSLALTAPAVRCSDGADDLPWWPGLLAGTTTATVAFPDVCSISADEPGTWSVTGTASYVVDGAAAEVLLTIADVPGHGTRLLEVDLTDPRRAARASVPAFDLTRELAHLALDHAPARVVGRPDIGDELRTTVATWGQLLLAAEQLGGIAACLRLAVDHAQTRYQFGRSLGSFQTIKHRLSDMYMAMELTRTAVAEASRLVDAGDPDAELWATVAHRTASGTYVQVAARSLQILGGLGFTWEHPVHLYLKRAKASQVLLGPPTGRERRIADLLGL
jgi:alkylation response protein AidB-like acyl-CoA dehydrogenase